jgi:hypothetical protein
MQTTAFMEMADLKILRHVETRWLQQIAVLERATQQFSVLKSYFQSACLRSMSKSSKAPSIRDRLSDPIMECDAHFRLASLKQLEGFEKLFQNISGYWLIITQFIMSLWLIYIFQSDRPRPLCTLFSPSYLKWFSFGCCDLFDRRQLPKNHGKPTLTTKRIGCQMRRFLSGMRLKRDCAVFPSLTN